MMLFPRGKGCELFDFFSLEGWPGRLKRGVPAFWAAFSESHVPCGLRPFQERVDTGTPLFCPVVVASKGSSLNHSA